MRTGRGSFDPMLRLLLFTNVVHAQLPFHPKFMAAGPDDSPFLEAQRDALNLHDGGDDASVALVTPIAINCTALGTDFKAVLLQKGAHPARHRHFGSNRLFPQFQMVEPRIVVGMFWALGKRRFEPKQCTRVADASCTQPPNKASSTRVHFGLNRRARLWVRCTRTLARILACALVRCGSAAVRFRVRGGRRGQWAMGGVWRSNRPVPDGLACVQGGAHCGHHRP